MSQDTNAYPFKQWLRLRLTRAQRDPGDALAKKLIGYTSIPARGSYALYVAHMRRLTYPEADWKLFDTLWKEMQTSSQT